MERIDSVKAEKMCTGCGACYNICPKKAISMPLNREGFFEPVIDEALCTNCGACGGVCPVRNASYENSDAPDCYAMMADDEVRAVSSSGGAFTVLARMILEKNGLVCGVAFSEDFRSAAFVTAETEQDLAKLRGSKYFMPETGDIYRKVKEALEKKRYVLFVGSPCHVAALKSFLGKRYRSEYLLTADLICHGIGSVKAFDKYMNDIHGDKTIKYLSFKDKRVGWRASMTIEFPDDSVFNMLAQDDAYFKSYLNGLNNNYACGNCRFSRIPRQGDVTIGDFWGISAYDPSLNDGKGTSVILVNSERGRNYVDAIAAKSKLFEAVPLAHSIPQNPGLVRSFHPHPARERFFENIDKASFDKLVTKCTDARYDVGILGLWYGINYGSILTYYALYCVINKMGFDALMINKPDFLWEPRFLDKNTIAHRFIDARCNVSEIPKTFADWEKLSDRCDTFVLGSDVVWNYNVCGKQSGQFFFMDFVGDDKKKIAMASSFGEGFYAPESVREVSEYYLRKFDFVSVREDEAVKECAEKFGVKADKVLDPVFLCGREVFDELADEAQLHEDSPFVAAYILGVSNPRTAEVAKELSKALDKPLKIIENPNVPGRFKQKQHMDCLPTPSVEEWLAYIRQSDFYLGDSFHGVCFALIFHVPFAATFDSRNLSVVRIISLLKMLHLEDRIFWLDRDKTEDKLPVLLSPIDFEETDKILGAMADASYKWLYSALTAPKKYQIQPQDTIIKNLREQLEAQKKAAVSGRQTMFNEIKANAAYSGRKYAEKRNIYDYLDALAKDERQLIIFIAVKDTPGMSFDQKMQVRFQKLGLRCSLLNMHWHSYVAVIGAGTIVSEILSKKDERVAYEGKLSCGDVKVVSRSLNQGNVAYIGIQGQDFSENRRGFNIVVYDRVSREVVDSVCFDTHDKTLPYYRFGKKFESVPHPTAAFECPPGQLELLPAGLQNDDASVYLCCKLAVEKSGGRKLFLWDFSQRFADMLTGLFGVDPENISSGPDLAPIHGKNKEYYVLVPGKKFRVSFQNALVRAGYHEVSDYLFYHIRPVVLTDRDYALEPYSDIYGNTVTGGYNGESRIVLNGYNINIDLGRSPVIQPGAKLTINCVHNSEITLGDRVHFSGEIQFSLNLPLPKTVEIGNDVQLVDNQFRVFGGIGHTLIRIGNGTTFFTSTCLHANSGKQLLIGNDVMFSLNVRVLCGDGHSIFNVETGKNTNSIPQNCDETRNSLVIGDHVWIGLNATLLAGTHIGNGSIVGANSLVKGTFPNNCSIGGNPAKLIKKNVAWSRMPNTQNIKDCTLGNYNLTNEHGSRKKVLVLGGTHLMGLKLVRQLVEKGYDVTISTRGKHADPFGTAVERILCDRLDEQAVSSQLGGRHFDIVFDTSAYSSKAVVNVLDHISCDRYIQVSSVAVYPGGGELKDESGFLSKTEPFAVRVEPNYNTGKREAECAALQLKRYQGIRTAIARIPFVVEPDNMNDKTGNAQLLVWAKAILKGTPIYVKNPENICSFIRTDDEAAFLIFLAESDFCGVVNISSEGHVTVKGIMDYLESKTGKRFVLRDDGVTVPFTMTQFDFSSKGFYFDLALAKSLGYRPEPLLDWLYPLLDRCLEDVSAQLRRESHSSM